MVQLINCSFKYSSRLETNWAFCGKIVNLGTHVHITMERGSSVVECPTSNQVSPGTNPPLLPFGRLGIFLLSIDAPVDSAE